jgi:hypothetical protein
MIQLHIFIKCYLNVDQSLYIYTRYMPVRCNGSKKVSTPSVSFLLSLDSSILHYPATTKTKRREYKNIDTEQQTSL